MVEAAQVTGIGDRGHEVGPPELRRAIELLFFAYRDFTGEADQLLERYGFGRAHHRVIYFVGRHPGVSVSGLLDILKITKQGLSPVLSQLVRDGFVIARPDRADRRRRRLFLTEEAQALERVLTARQSARLAAAFAEAGPDAASGFTQVLEAIIAPEVRHRVALAFPDPMEGSPRP
ncbi:MAG: MarR family transcriptional regulator [Rhodospirillales bacterium]|nr:MAG: MarR family transcriptional regulator [Rhodospirillales bacterium]